MVYTARELINEAYYLSGIVARELQSVSGDQAISGLRLLNGLLAVKSINLDMIPYFKEHIITPVTGQEKYFVPNLLKIETVTYNLSTVRFPTIIMGRKDYFGSARPEQITSIPFTCHMEKCVGGANMYFWFQPSSTIGPIKLWAKFGFEKIGSSDEDLSTEFDFFYFEYLRFALAEYICADYNITFQPQSKQKLDELEAQISNISPIDLSMKKVSCLQSRNLGFNWAVANLYKGYTP